MLKVGNKDVKSIFYKENEVLQVYKGDKLIWYKYFPRGYEILIDVNGPKDGDTTYAEFLSDDENRPKSLIGIHLATQTSKLLNPKGYVTYSYKRPNQSWKNHTAKIPIDLIQKKSYEQYEQKEQHFFLLVLI
ncbi:hypothetical protein [Lactobacillus sp.]|uniref:hypothetical protein n=1 Tax=Lactobacillus sp. TaxID=1591 RepID=UPI0019C10D9F|nr:hypothetical protein [Lactobacillus sp.]MBD5429722.1 hypothetical protein [Lactobacillus sp.]